MMLLAEAALRSSLLTLVVWLALKLCRAKNSHTQMAAWSGVLLASLAMPLLMRWVPAETLPVPPQFFRSTVVMPMVAGQPTAAAAEQVPATFSFMSWALAAYALIAAILVARLGLGLVQGLRLVRRSSPIDASCDIRLSTDLAMPAAIGRTILVPVEFLAWDEARRKAVLAHETSHIERGDFYLLLLAALHRALFWFNPLSWWLHNRLADLAETNSDAAALAVAQDRLSYAQILIDLAGQARTLPTGLAMAATATVRRRVEHILAESTLPARLTLRKLMLVAAGMIPAALAAAGATTAALSDEALVKQRMADQARPRTAITLDPAALDKFTGYYALPATPDLPFKVSHRGQSLFASPLGQPAQEFLAENDHSFFARETHEQGDFQTDGKGRVTVLWLHMNGHIWPAYRLDDAAGQALEKKLADRIAANQPQPSSEAALRTHIDQLQRGEIDDRTLVNGMGDGIRAILPQIRPDMLALGPVTEVKFQGVGPDGMDIYLVTHAQGANRWQIRLTSDGRIESMWFNPVT